MAIFNSLIRGLELSVDADLLTVRCSSGSAQVPTAPNRRYLVVSDITVTAVSPTPSSWLHVYLTGATTLLLSPTAPAAPYQAKARTLPGNTAGRYLGSVRVGSDGKLIPFLHTSSGPNGNRVDLLSVNGLADAVAALLLNGVATTSTVIDASGVFPPTARLGILQIDNAATVPLYLSNPDRAPVSASKYLRRVRAGLGGEYTLALDSSQRFNYIFVGVIGLGYADFRAVGYFFDR